MPATQSAYEWLRSRATAPRPTTTDPAPVPPPAPPSGPPAERDARAEIDRLREQIEGLVAGPRDVEPRDALDAALGKAARLQVVSANLDACNPPKGDHLSRTLVAFADRRLTGHADAIERGMTYTADNTLRLLSGE
jgi:hypothetical protein